MNINMRHPLVSVLLSVHNGGGYLSEAIASILSQTFVDFEFIIIDDGSDDDTPGIIDTCSDKDSRIKVYHQENLGRTASLNSGLSLADGKYIARMDADDVSLPDRLATQVDFMERHTEVGICGTWVKTIGASPERYWHYPERDDEIRCLLLFQSALAHPSTMLRRDMLLEANLTYDPSCHYAEDYDLWVRATQHTRLANIPEVLLYYRLHEHQEGSRHQSGRQQETTQIILGQLERLGLSVDNDTMALHYAIANNQVIPTVGFLDDAERWLLALLTTNKKKRLYPEPAFSRLLSYYWFLVCRGAVRLGHSAWRRFWNSSLSKEESLHITTKLRFWTLCSVQSLKKNA